MSDLSSLLTPLERIADALDRLAPPPAPALDFDAASAFLWQPETNRVAPVARVPHVPLAFLAGLEAQRDTLFENSLRHAQGLPANNALLWGARGVGKSSIVKAIHAEINQKNKVRLVEILREDIATLPRLLKALTDSPHRFILFCDDLSFEAEDEAYKALKAVLEGGLSGKPENVIFYATSNRRHLLSRQMIENERSKAIMPSEAVEEKVSLSDRFGLWLGFHNMGQDVYLEIVGRYATALDLSLTDEDLRAAAIEWAATRGSRSGRVAWQLVTDLAGREGKNLNAILAD